MIDGEPRIIERDGRRLVVDQSGAELVCRCHRQTSSAKQYHRISVEAFERDGTIEPDCDHSIYTDPRWLLRRRRDLDGIWSGCSYQSCYGDYVKGSADNSGPTLANTLLNMTVEEFDAQVAGGKQ